MSEHWLYILASIIIGAMLLLAVLGLGLTTIVPGMDKWSRRFFACFFAILSLCVCTFFVSPLAEGNPSMAMAQRIADYAESLLGSILIAMPMFYLTHCCNEDWRKSMIIRAVFVFWFAYFVFLEIAQFTTAIYYYSQSNVFLTGPLYPLPIAFTAILLIQCIVAVIRRRSKLSKKRFRQ